LISTEENNINSFNVIYTKILPINKILDSRISCIELKNGDIALAFLEEENQLGIAVYEIEKLNEFIVFIPNII
jgi:hypothetical protein